MKTAKQWVTACFALITAAVLTGCGSPPPEADDAPPATISSAQPSFSDVEALGVRNAAMPSPGLVTAGQPTQEQFDALAEMGYTNFISLRPTTEDGAGWEEEHVMRSAVSFDRIPVAGGAGLTRENVDRLAQALEDAEDRAVLYCASSNRVGSLLALKAYWHDGATPEEALEIGRAAGMRSLEGRVTELLAEPR